jgi:hypothetical protein
LFALVKKKREEELLIEALDLKDIGQQDRAHEGVERLR